MLTPEVMELLLWWMLHW